MKSAYQNLGEFISELEKAGELLRIKAPVSRDLEITHITDLASKAPGGGKALLFERVRESLFPVLTNAFGSERRICMALGTDSLDELAQRIERFVRMEPPKSLRQMANLVPMGIDLIRFLPRKTRKAPCQEVVYRGEEIDLSMLPVLKCWPQDGGPFVTLPVVITRSLETGRRNAGMYRLQVFDRNTTGMHWHIHKDGSHYFQEYRKAGKRMPVAVAIGTDPAVTYAATAPLPRGIDEMILAGFIRKRPVQMARCVSIDLEVPAEAEFVLEGYVDPEETPAGRTIRRPHRVLFTCWRVSGLSPDGADPSPKPRLLRDHRGAAPDGRLLSCQSHGAHIPPDAGSNSPRGPRFLDALGRGVP